MPTLADCNQEKYDDLIVNCPWDKAVCPECVKIVQPEYDDGAFDYEYGSIKGTHRYPAIWDCPDCGYEFEDYEAPDYGSEY